MSRSFTRVRLAIFALAFATMALPLGRGPVVDASSRGEPKPTIVLIHGDWADASGWTDVITRLQDKGYKVLAPPNGLRGPAVDVPAAQAFLATVPGPIVLVGHSYGGIVITNAATGNPNVKALVYIDAFLPDTGQTLAELNPGSCLDPSTGFDVVPIPGDTDLYLRIGATPTYLGFNECFANGVSRREAAVLAATQRPASVNQLSQPSGTPAWKTIPSWALIGTADRVITPSQQRAMAEHAGAHISTVNAGHLSLITRPDAVTKIIQKAVDATT